MRFELMTSSLPRRRSTPELRGPGSANFSLRGPSNLKQNKLKFVLLNWSGRRDSNSRPSAWKADALPTELHPPTLRSQISDLKFVSSFKPLDLKSQI
jgi:hypothetical protein